MKKSLTVRILTALGSLVLLAASAAMAAEAFFGVPVTAQTAALLADGSILPVLAKLVMIIGLAVLAGAAFVCALPRPRREQKDFVMQKGENGAIGISVRAIEKQVRTCIAKHDVIADAEVSIRECRDGLIILLNVDQVAGVNIPLSVGLLQKQIKQYVASCTGVDVHEVRVMVENNTTTMVPSPFAVEDAMLPAARPVAEEPAVIAEPATPAEPPKSVEAPAENAAPAQPAQTIVLPELPPAPALVIEEDERPLHQRIFGAEEQPVIVPAPPELLSEVPAEAEEPQEEAEELQVEADLEAEPAAEAADELLMDAAEAGAAYSEALWEDEEDVPASAEDAEEEAEEPQPLPEA